MAAIKAHITTKGTKWRDDANVVITPIGQVSTHANIVTRPSAANSAPRRRANKINTQAFGVTEMLYTNRIRIEWPFSIHDGPVDGPALGCITS